MGFGGVRLKNGFFSLSKLARAVLHFTGLFLIGSMLAGCIGSNEPLNLSPQSLVSVNGEVQPLLEQASLVATDSSENADAVVATATPTKAPRSKSGRQFAATSTTEIENSGPNAIPVSKPSTTKPLSSPTPVKRFFKKPAPETKLALFSDGINDKPKRKASFFQRLFQKRKTKPRPPLGVKNQLEPGESALPGVKSNASIFGIGGEDQEVESRVQLASVGGFGRLSPNGLRLQHEKVKVACFKPELLRVLKMVQRKFKKIPIVTSGYRSPRRNRRAGGVSRSQHIYCKAADIQIEGVSKWVLAKYLRSLPGRGGVGTYCRTKSVHIDVGSKRDWHHPCRRRSARKKRKA